MNFSLNQTLLTSLLYVRTTWMTQLILAIFLRGYFTLNQKDSTTHPWSCSSCEGRTSFHNKTTLENSADSYVCFQMALLHSVSGFFFLYQSLSWSLCTVFDVISSNIHEVLSVNPSTLFVFTWYEEVPPIIQGFRVSPFNLSVS